MRRVRKRSDTILQYGTAGTKRVHEEGIIGKELLVEPFIGLDDRGCVGVGAAVIDLGTKQCIGAWFWGEEGPANPFILEQALALLEAVTVLRPNTLCGAYLAAKGMNGDGPSAVHEVLAELGDQAVAILAQPPDRLDDLLRTLRRRHYPIAAAFAQSA